MSITLCLCWGIVINPESDPEIVKSAFALIGTIIAGLVGFVTLKAIS
ncbi:MAG: hypothetical protein AAFN00_02420 [Cyanobacteria bacterium J06558_2]